MLTHTAILVALLAPQQEFTPAMPPQAAPSAPTPPATTSPHSFASALPEDTLIAAHIGVLGEQRGALRETALAAIVRALPVPPETVTALAAMADSVRTITGLDDATLLGALEHGMTVALLRLDADGTPGIVLAANLPGDPEIYRAGLERAARHFGSTQDEHLGTAIWTLQPPGSKGPGIATCIQANHLMAATGIQDLRAALDRQASADSISLADHPAYREFEQTTLSDGNRLFSCFVQTRTVVGDLLTRLGATQLEQARRLVKALQLHHVHSIGYTVRVEDGRFQDHLRVFFPEPRNGLLGALAGPGTPLTVNTSRLVPPGVSSFTISHVDLQRVLEETTKLAEAVDPRVATMMRGGLQALAKQTGVDLEQDVLASLAQQMVTLQWPSEDGSFHFALVLATRDSWRLEKALLRLLGAFDMRPKPRTWRGHSVYHIEPSPGAEGGKMPVQISYGIDENHIVLATSEDAMRSTLTQLAEPTENRAALHFLSRLPPGATSAGWTALGPTVQGLLVHAEMSGAVPHDMIQSIRDAFTGMNGEMETFVAMDPGGISIRTRSPVGNLLAVGTAFVVASIAIPSAVRARELQTANAMVEPDAELRDLLRRIAAAQQERVRSSAQSSFATLDQLAADGNVEPQQLGEPMGDGVYRRGDYLLAAILPREARDRRSDFAVLAWPADERRGSVLATTAAQPMLENRAIASSAGIKLIEPADLFLSGEFGTALVPGWREALEPVAVKPATAPRDQVLMAAILLAEQEKTKPVPEEVLEGLTSTNNTVAARAAWALGELAALEAVPKLCGVLENHQDVEVCRQAMSALVKMSDPRSVVASTRALSSGDLIVRTMAARNLGALRATEAAESLIGVVGRDDAANESSDAPDSDRLAALLALTDLGATDAMLPAAAAVTAPKGELAQAIAFMFQTLSSRLDVSEEAVVLMAVLDHPSTALRRYAIQRLGELKNPTSLTALEGRLGGEDDRGLRPLIEVSLQAIRGSAPPADGETAGNPLVAATAAWERLTPQQRGMVAAGGTGTLMLFAALLFWRSRRRRAAQGEQWAAFTAPSDDFAGDEDVVYDDAGEFGDGHDAANFAAEDVPGVFDETGDGEFMDDVDLDFDEDEEMFVEGSAADYRAAERHGR